MEIQNKQTLRNIQPALQQVNTTPIRTKHGKINGYKALTDKETNRHINVVTDKYTVVQHKDIIQSTLNALDATNTDVTGWIEGEQDTMIIELLIDEPNYKIKDASSNGKYIKFGFRITNSYDSSSSLNFEAFGFREKCDNGMFLGRELLKSKRKYHVGSINIESMTETVIGIIDAIREEKTKIKNLFEKMMTTSITKEQAFKETNDLFSAKKHVDNILNKIGVTVIRIQKENKEEKIRLIEEEEFEDVTLWDLYNAFTNYATHSENISRNIKNKVQEQSQVLLGRVSTRQEQNGERE